MVMKTEKLTVELVFSTKKIVRLTEELKGKNLSELYFKALNSCDVKALAIIISAFAENDGKPIFNGDINKAYDFVDAYKKENNKTYQQIYEEIAEVINEEGFFTKKMTAEEMTTMKSSVLSSIDIEETVKTAVNRIATEAVEKEFKGYQG